MVNLLPWVKCIARGRSQNRARFQVSKIASQYPSVLFRCLSFSRYISKTCVCFESEFEKKNNNNNKKVSSLRRKRIESTRRVDNDYKRFSPWATAVVVSSAGEVSIFYLDLGRIEGGNDSNPAFAPLPSLTVQTFRLL